MKRIVICADGTWNQRDQLDKATGRRRPTNVTKVARGVLTQAPDGVNQVVYYHSGVGTGGPLDTFTGGAFGHGMEANVREMYRFILYNHEPGDALFLFGFSRGAFTVRTLAGFMHRYGLVRKRDDYYVPDMYRCYEQGWQEGSPQWQQLFVRENGSRRIEQVRECPPIRFIGVWDTVGALGAPGLLGQLFNRQRYQYHQVGLNSSIQAVAHAIALDERRKPFAASVYENTQGWTGDLQQAWFAGVHSDVGGGYEWDGLANEALHWVVMHAERAGLAFDRDYLQFFKTYAKAELHDSMSLMYRASGPLLRPVGQAAGGNEALHRSVLVRADDAARQYPPRDQAGVAERLQQARAALPVVDTVPAPPVKPG